MRISPVPELFLRHVWQHQLFTTSHLVTSDGSPIVVLFPGSSNPDAGPDFRNASIRIGPILFRGDVELHIDSRSWHAHRHSCDPHYNKVILHVALTAGRQPGPATTASRRAIPLLVLYPFLAPLLRETWLESEHRETASIRPQLLCAGDNAVCTSAAAIEWIRFLGRERLEMRIGRLRERLHQLLDERRHAICEPYPRYDGDPADIPIPERVYSRSEYSTREVWEQLLYEHIMEGMGYTKNSMPFLSLARFMRLSILRRHGLRNTQTVQALLFGAAGLLPVTRTLQELECRMYVRALRRRWKELRPFVRIPLLHEGDWLFFRLRPSNFPTARLASFCHILPSFFDEGSFQSMISLFRLSLVSPRTLHTSLVDLFRFTPDRFWSRHFHFRGRAGNRGIALGSSRITDLLLNTFIPFVLLYARIFHDHAVHRGASALLASLPPPQITRGTRIVERDLFRKSGPARSAVEHQGMVQLYKYYCTAGRCSECAVGREQAQAQHNGENSVGASP